MPAQDYLAARDLFQREGRQGAEATRRARRNLTNRLTEYGKDHLDMSRAQARAWAGEAIRQVAVPHNPDQVLGGGPEPARDASGAPVPGDRGVNSSLGAQNLPNAVVVDAAARRQVAAGRGHLPLGFQVVLTARRRSVRRLRARQPPPALLPPAPRPDRDQPAPARAAVDPPTAPRPPPPDSTPTTAADIRRILGITTPTTHPWDDVQQPTDAPTGADLPVRRSRLPGAWWPARAFPGTVCEARVREGSTGASQHVPEGRKAETPRSWTGGTDQVPTRPGGRPRPGPHTASRRRSPGIAAARYPVPVTEHTTPSTAAPMTSPSLPTPSEEAAPVGSSAAWSYPVEAVPQPAPFAPVGRIPVTEVFPVVEDGRWPAKAVVGEVIPVRATVFREGHDHFGATAVLVRPDGTDGPSARMHEVAVGLDRYEARLAPDSPGDWRFRVEGWSDPYGTWAHDASIKVPAGVDVELMLEEGARVMERAAQVPGRAPEDTEVLTRAAAALRDNSQSAEARLAAGVSQEVATALERLPLRDLVSPSASYPLQVDRTRALAGSWYEIFPRSLGSGADEHGNWHSGTLRTAAEHLDRIAAMGFDVLYLTPVSPIGTTNRKGRNNTLTARPGDPGSPYGIGSPEGGHDVIHPDLGTFDDFDALVERARQLGMEVALDLALQCSPDHPWVAEHPEWFTVLADGSIAYAENPPKKYQDIYPLNFDNDPEGIYQAILEVVRTWVRHGVTIFRVDNPHTKPLPFWQRLIAQVRAESPDVLFLAEAFTRPAMMRTLGKIGFHQSYTYFAWRNTKEELTDYVVELSQETAHVLRPTFWPTTHDILTPFMTAGKVPAFRLRAVLAATLSPTWGIYSGYELAESVPRPGYEEQIDNEKYEYKPRDFAAARSNGIEELLTRLNAARAAHPALRQLREVWFHPTSDDHIIAYSKRVDAAHSPTGHDDTVLTVVNLDPHSARAGEVFLNLEALGLPAGTDGSRPVVRVTDLLDEGSYEWSGQNYVRLDPFVGQAAHVFAVEAL